jgi:hypothetical protein
VAEEWVKENGWPDPGKGLGKWVRELMARWVPNGTSRTTDTKKKVRKKKSKKASSGTKLSQDVSKSQVEG